jgi:hypothetical protein
MGAIALLTADAFTTGHWTVTHALQPLLVLGATAAGVLCHRGIAHRRPLSAFVFAIVAALASCAAIFATLGRQADARDAKVSSALAQSRQLANINDELTTARRDAAVECKSGFGSKCASAKSRVDALVASMASLKQVSEDPRADAIADLLWLVAGADKAHTKAVVGAIEPLVLPLTLEIGALVFLGAAFPTRRNQPRVAPVADQSTASVANPLTKAEALVEFRKMREAGAQDWLAAQWGRDKSTVSRWLREWQEAGLVTRQREGRYKRALAALK